MAGRDIIHSTMRRGFRAYFGACLPSTNTTRPVREAGEELTEEIEEESIENIVLNVRQRRERRPRMPWGYARRHICQSPKPIPDKKIKAFHASICEGPLDNCAICYDAINVGEAILSLNCTETTWHTFHENCVSTWLNKEGNCPLCREEIL